MADSTPKSYHTDPTLYLYTSLTAGSSHIITATSRLETILKANKIPFLALDVATDEKARMLWGRRAGKRKLPGLVRMGMVVGDLEEVEEWNEYGELKENLAPGAAAPPISTPSAPSTPSKPPKPTNSPSKPLITSATPPQPSQPSATDSPLTTAMRQAGLEAAKKAGDAKLKARIINFGDSKASSDVLKKLDNSTIRDMPPPTGTTEASPVVVPESGSTAVESKARTISVTSTMQSKNTVHFQISKGRDSPVVATPPVEESHSTGENKKKDLASEEDDVDKATAPKKPPPTELEKNPQSSSNNDDKDGDDDDDDDDDENNEAAPRRPSNPPNIEPENQETYIIKLLKQQGKTGGPLLDHTKLDQHPAGATATIYEAEPLSNTKKPQEQDAADRGEVGASVKD